jgi:Fe-S oxidoreductase
VEKAKDLLSQYREEILKCTSCGFCQAACPVFGATLRPAYNTRGKMLLLKEVMEGLIEPSRDLAETFYTCTTCRACTYSCPRSIKAAELVEGVRRRLYEQGFAPGSLVAVKDNICRTGNVFAAGGKERIEVYPPSLREKVRRGELKEKAETLVFMGCLPSYLDMKTVPSLLKTLEAADVNCTTLASEESCCGFPLFLLGAGEFKPHAEKLLKNIRATGARELVTPCAGCYKTFQTLYPEIGDLGMRIYHTVQYLEKLASEERLTFDQPLPSKVTYHDPCDIGRACQIFEEPRSILRRIPGVEFVEMAKNRMEARCCGGGGGLQAYAPDLASEMAAKRVQDALAVGADVIVSGCPACKDNLKKGLRLIPKEERRRIKVLDIVEMVSKALNAQKSG